MALSKYTRLTTFSFTFPLLHFCGRTTHQNLENAQNHRDPKSKSQTFFFAFPPPAFALLAWICLLLPPFLASGAAAFALAWETHKEGEKLSKRGKEASPKKRKALQRRCKGKGNDLKRFAPWLWSMDNAVKKEEEGKSDHGKAILPIPILAIHRGFSKFLATSRRDKISLPNELAFRRHCWSCD